LFAADAWGFNSFQAQVESTLSCANEMEASGVCRTWRLSNIMARFVHLKFKQL